MKKKRTQAFLIPILLSLPLLQMVAVMIVGEVYLRWTVIILSVLFYLLLTTNYIFWYHLNRKIDVYHQRIVWKLEHYSKASAQTKNILAAEDTVFIPKVVGNDELRKNIQCTYPYFLSRLHEAYPALTEADEFLCMLIKSNLSNKEVMEQLSISQGSLHTTRYRLKRKLAIPKEVNLDDWIRQFE